jgi:predicted nucleic acid-binding protein
MVGVMVYADTSVLVSLYMLDANTSRAIPLVRSLANVLAYTALIRLEIRSAFSLAVFRGHQTASQSGAAWQNLERDIRAKKILVPKAIHWPAALRRAAILAHIETPSLGTRSFDILHVACAEQLRATEFLSFDHRQRVLAQRAGLVVRP